MNEAIIAEDLTIDGDLLAKDTRLAVKGRINGDVVAKSIDIQPSGEVVGSLSAETVTISGTLKGSVKCSDLSLENTARVEAELTTNTLASNKGAKLIGKVEVKGV